MLPLEHSAILLTFFELPFAIKIFVLSIFEWPFYTGFTVHPFKIVFSIIPTPLGYPKVTTHVKGLRTLLYQTNNKFDSYVV